MRFAMTQTPSVERWLGALTPFVVHHLPATPGRIVEIGCGPLGGFVPRLSARGYDVVGVDPEAPEGPAYRTIEFEAYDAPEPVNAIVASVSLHHVADLETVLDKVADCLVPGGDIVVAEWAHERFDESTAQWCFDRLGPPDEGKWLHHHLDSWQASGVRWESYLENWADAEGLHDGDTIIQALRARFETRVLTRAPYFFPDLHETTESDERAAIDSGRIRPNGIRYVGRRT
jgi:SAM-dependent methyltransferase